jgi:hypothetical protein
MNHRFINISDGVEEHARTACGNIVCLRAKRRERRSKRGQTWAISGSAAVIILTSSTVRDPLGPDISLRISASMPDTLVAVS